MPRTRTTRTTAACWWEPWSATATGARSKQQSGAGTVDPFGPPSTCLRLKVLLRLEAFQLLLEYEIDLQVGGIRLLLLV